MTDAQARVFAPLTAAERDQLLDLLQKVIRGSGIPMIAPPPTDGSAERPARGSAERPARGSRDRPIRGSTDRPIPPSRRGRPSG